MTRKLSLASLQDDIKSLISKLKVKKTRTTKKNGKKSTKKGASKKSKKQRGG